MQYKNILSKILIISIIISVVQIIGINGARCYVRKSKSKEIKNVGIINKENNGLLSKLENGSDDESDKEIEDSEIDEITKYPESTIYLSSSVDNTIETIIIDSTTSAFLPTTTIADIKETTTTTSIDDIESTTTIADIKETTTTTSIDDIESTTAIADIKETTTTTSIDDIESTTTIADIKEATTTSIDDIESTTTIADIKETTITTVPTISTTILTTITIPTTTTTTTTTILTTTTTTTTTIADIKETPISTISCGEICNDGNKNCSSGFDKLFTNYGDLECYISEITSGRQDSSSSLIGGNNTNEKSEYLINNLKDKKYQLNGWLYCRNTNEKQNKFGKYSKIRLENLEGNEKSDIDCVKSFYELINKDFSNKYSTKPIKYAVVSTSNEYGSSIVNNEISLVNSVTYYDEDDNVVDKCNENIYYKVYLGENSWDPC
ncbi:hypothetical protein BCR36DRAFT_588083 [Piromyces finnis]|uniref:Uncharacterized protein n=1 Tax=Piromyces finnis TaxID=1754191 RepID=A0A1Y1UTJ9_9FUNG|nr:hypothetical protein BCR36DRAFT_588083 [Piromyces finnis]|eukprot:ORX41348.1 hypothetical protein BCR36DRAFT_588083 [Piromyces finnis]